MSKDLLPVWDLVCTAHIVGLRLTESLAPTGLSPTQFAVLMHLENEPGLSRAELARRTFIRPQSMGILLQTLRTHNLVDQRGPGGRGRRTGLAITDTGRALLSEAWLVVRKLNTPQNLGLTQTQTKQLITELAAIRSAAVQSRTTNQGTQI